MAQKIRIYTTQYCPHCTRAKDLLRKKGLPFEEIDVTGDQKKRREIEETTGWMTVPVIFIGDEFVGGADNLYALEKLGQLDVKIAGAGPAFQPIGKNTSLQWYYRPASVLVALFIFGPFAFPLLWKSPKYNRIWKTILTVLFTAATVYILAVTWNTFVLVSQEFKRQGLM